MSLYARQWCHAPDDALQEALIELLRQSPAPDNPVAWLYKTLRRAYGPPRPIRPER